MLGRPSRSARRRPEIDEADRLQPMRAHLIGGADARAARRAISCSRRASRALPVAPVGLALAALLLARCREAASWLGSNSADALAIRLRCCSSSSASECASASPRLASCDLDLRQALVGDALRASAADRRCRARPAPARAPPPCSAPARALRSASSSWLSVRSSPLSPSGRSGLRSRSASVQIAVTGMISSCRRAAPAP